ncbi:MAG: HNH endonuclease [Tolypothrix sp. Co-bin9]|nr:HNH endonuclease [Tolypothrix sp. Co-bin9]
MGKYWGGESAIAFFGNYRTITHQQQKGGVQQMIEPSPEQPGGSRARCFTTGERENLMVVLKRKRKIHLQEDGQLVYDNIKPQDHGIKRALLKRPLLTDTSAILQKLIVDILHTTTERNVRELILTAMRQMKWETELFTKQLETHIAEVERQEKENRRELTEAEKVKIKQRDGYTCLCCGANTESKLEIGYIKPLSMGGKTSIENSQTLCVICYRCKSDNEMNFRCKTTKLSIPINLDLSFRTESQSTVRTLTRIVNLFYHCKAVYKVKWEVQFYAYNIYLYPGNNPEWLLKHRTELLKYIQDKLGREAYNLQITTTE